MFRYCQIFWTPTEVPGGFLLKPTADKPCADPKRVLFVSEKGVFECTRDGKNEPLELMDCGPATLTRVQLVASTAKTEVK